jgi:hypothetical protein
MGLRPLADWDCGFESRRGHGCLSLVSVVCCQIEVSVSGRSLVRSRIPTTVVCLSVIKGLHRGGQGPLGLSNHVGERKHFNTRTTYMTWMISGCLDTTMCIMRCAARTDYSDNNQHHRQSLLTLRTMLAQWNYCLKCIRETKELYLGRVCSWFYCVLPDKYWEHTFPFQLHVLQGLLVAAK